MAASLPKPLCCPISTRTTHNSQVTSNHKAPTNTSTRPRRLVRSWACISHVSQRQPINVSVVTLVIMINYKGIYYNRDHKHVVKLASSIVARRLSLPTLKHAALHNNNAQSLTPQDADDYASGWRRARLLRWVW